MRLRGFLRLSLMRRIPALFRLNTRSDLKGFLPGEVGAGEASSTRCADRNSGLSFKAKFLSCPDAGTGNDKAFDSPEAGAPLRKLDAGARRPNGRHENNGENASRRGRAASLCDDRAVKKSPAAGETPAREGNLTYTSLRTTRIFAASTRRWKPTLASAASNS